MAEHTIAGYVQYMADSIDATVFLKALHGKEPSTDDVAAFLHDEGWGGRKYPTDFFRSATVPPSLLFQPENN